MLIDEELRKEITEALEIHNDKYTDIDIRSVELLDGGWYVTSTCKSFRNSDEHLSYMSPSFKKMYNNHHRYYMYALIDKNGNVMRIPLTERQIIDTHQFFVEDTIRTKKLNSYLQNINYATKMGLMIRNKKGFNELEDNKGVEICQLKQ